MKKLFEKHTVAKLLGILIFVAIVLTWVLPYGMFQGTEFTKLGTSRLGLGDIPMIAYNSIYFAVDKMVYLFVLAGFYAVISKTDGYNKLVSNIVKKIKGKETLFVIVTSVVLAVLTSVTTSSFAMLLFVPLLITIMLNAGLNKLTAFASTFGAILVGILGATLGTEALTMFNGYYSQTLVGDSAKDLTMSYRIVILCVELVLYNFFLYYAAKKSLDSKKKKEEIAEEFKIEEVGKKKVKVFPIAIVFAILGIVAILGFVDWVGIFKINTFTDFHTWLTELKIGEDFTLVSYILGTNALPFGSWDLFAISTVLLILTVLTAILYSIKCEDLFTTFGNGALRMVKPVGAMVAVYSVFIIVYMSPIIPTIVDKVMHKDGVVDLNIDYNGAGVAIFNVDTDDDGKADYNLVNIDTDKDGKCDINCDTNKDGYPDKNLDFDGDKRITETDESIIKQLDGGKSTSNLDIDGDGIPDINLDTSFSLVRTIAAATVTNTFAMDLGYTGYSLSDYLISGYGAVALSLVFIVFFTIFGLLQFFIPTSVLLLLGLTYTKVDYKDWMKHIWRFVLAMVCVLLIIFIFISVR